LAALMDSVLGKSALDVVLEPIVLLDEYCLKWTLVIVCKV
jgi:hypothetical protein